MKYTKEDKRRWLLLQCRYYNGEKEVPEEIEKEGKGIFWDYEYCWVLEQLEHPLLDEEYQQQAKQLGVTLATWDKTPLSLKVILFERCLHWSSGYATIEEELKSFDTHMYVDYVIRETNKERRTRERTNKLTEKCKLFRGKWSDHFVSDPQKNFICRCEEEWVDALADSYSNRERFLEELQNTPVINALPVHYWKMAAHNHNMPATLLACIAKNYAKEYKETYGDDITNQFKKLLFDYEKLVKH